MPLLRMSVLLGRNHLPFVAASPVDTVRRHIHIHSVMRHPHGIRRGMHARSTWYDVDLTVGELKKNMTGVLWFVMGSVDGSIGTNIF
jgi:hypothetical protein